jgi:hypothetical protein
MAIETHIHDGASWRKAKSLYVHDGSVWRDCKEAWCHDGTSWRKVFTKGYWQLVCSTRSGITSGHVVTEICAHGTDIYCHAREPTYTGATPVPANVYEWNGSSWSSQYSYNVFPSNTPRLFGDVYDWNLFYYDGTAYRYVTGSTPTPGVLNAPSFDVWTLCTLSGGTTYIAKGFDAFGQSVWRWSGTTWVSDSSNVYECRDMTEYGGQLWVNGNPISGGSIYDWRVMKKTGGGTYSTYAMRAGASYIETGLLVGDGYDVYARDDLGLMRSNAGGAFVSVSGYGSVGTLYGGNGQTLAAVAYEATQGYRAVLPLNSPTAYSRMISGTRKDFDGTVFAGSYSGTVMVGSDLYHVSRGAGTSDPVYLYKWVGDFPR